MGMKDNARQKVGKALTAARTRVQATRPRSRAAAAGLALVAGATAFVVQRRRRNG